MVANTITVARLPLLVVIILLLYSPSPIPRLVSVFLLGLLIIMDTIDGMVARARNEVSLLGSVLDIMADRVVELVLWVCYAHLGLIPVAIPIIYIFRGTVVDSLRSVYVGAGQAPFKAMRTKLGKWLVGSPFMRSTYGASKLITFAGLALTHALAAYAARGAVSEEVVHLFRVIFNVTSWISVAFCLARGLPVIIEALPPLDKLKTLRGHFS
ncbi:MAG: CDP-alcohol phosphatidyltransferase family protein [Anaerolineae bacterium]|nr:CDP-alcohol phosphatidyltransferase family protein [Anaerolineae bacterium]